MVTTRPRTTGVTDTSGAVHIEQYSRRRILGIWAAAALPMAALSWVVAPLLARTLDGPAALTRALLLCLTAGLVWQGVLVAALVHREQGTLRWRAVKAALWLNAPRSPRTGRTGGMLWLVLIPCLLIFMAEEVVPAFPPAAGHNMAEFLGSDAGADLFSGSWAWFALMVVLTVFNTVLGEELLFRGVLLPRMRGAFGRGDWVVNGVLFATYHLHMPWTIPATLLDTLAISYPSRRFRSALIGIAVHSAQTVVILGLVLAMTLK
jgi:membrane protease YdiL (CAAX protease family)